VTYILIQYINLMDEKGKSSINAGLLLSSHMPWSTDYSSSLP